MQFKPESINAIVNGSETQTRRVCKVGENAWDKLDTIVPPARNIHTVTTSLDRIKWQVGRDYAVSRMYEPGVWWHPLTKEWRYGEPEMAKHSLFWEPLRIRLLSIRREPLQAITEADARMEGWPGLFECGDFPVAWYSKLWRTINGPKSWDDNPDVWCLTFEVKL